MFTATPACTSAIFWFTIMLYGTFRSFIPNMLRRRSLVTGGLESLVKNGFKINGLFTTKGIERYLRTHVLKENSFGSLGVDLYIVATQLNHSRKVVFGNFPETYKDKTIKYGNFATISEAVAAITRLGAHKLMEANEKATELLVKGLTVEGLPGWDGGRGQTIRYVD